MCAMVDILRYLFSLGLLGSGLGVIRAGNPVNAALLLVLAFGNARGRWLLLGVEFRALLLLAVYVGAVRVLFLFVVRRLNVQPLSGNALERGRHRPRAVVLGTLYLGERLWLVSDRLGILSSGGKSLLVTGDDWVGARDQVTNLERLGQVLYTHRLAPFLIAGVVLLVARVGAIVLTVTVPTENSARTVSRRQRAHEQLSRDSGRAVFLRDRSE